MAVLVLINITTQIIS